MKSDFCWVTVSQRAFDDINLKRLVEYCPGGIRFNSGRNSFDWIEISIKKLLEFGYNPGKIFIDVGNQKRRVKTKHVLHVHKGQFIILGNDNDKANDLFMTTQISFHAGDIVFFADGQIEARVDQISSEKMKLQMLTDGEITNNTSVSIKGDNTHTFNITSEEENKIKSLLKKYPVGLIISFIECGNDIRVCKDLFHMASDIIPKIETCLSVENIEEILEEASTILIGRGDLALSLGYEKIGVATNRILDIAKGNRTIVGSGTLSSLIHGFLPTQAEIVDITNSYIRGAAGILLTDETAKGDNPFLPIEWVMRIVNQLQNIDV